MTAVAKATGLSPKTIRVGIGDLGYSLQSHRKTKEGESHPDRDAQFQHIHDQVQDFQARGQPVISVDPIWIKLQQNC